MKMEKVFDGKMTGWLGVKKTWLIELLDAFQKFHCGVIAVGKPNIILFVLLIEYLFS